MSWQASRCVSNNLGWYAALLRTHGVAGAIADGVWTCREKVPPFHSNAVTVEPTNAQVQTDVIRALEADLVRPFSVKDSFAVLDLAPLGMRPLVDAEWIWRDPSSGPPAGGRRDVEWRPVMGEKELGRWEAAWRNDDSPAEARVFLPDLLMSGEVVLLAAHRGGRIVAGCAANRTPGVVGFSDFFTDEADREPLMASAIAAILRVAPGLPVVGYESGEDLAGARRSGFEAVGPLRVWLAE